MRKFLFFFVISLLAFPSLGQEVIKGRVVDVGTRESLREVQVQSSFSEKTTFTNNSGYFFIPINHLPSDLNLPLSYAVHNNTLFWDFAQKVKIVIFSTGGQILLSTSQNKTGKLKLPIPSVGYYGLHISGGEKEVRFLLFSDGHNIRISKVKKFSMPTKLYDSSLIFSKAKYYPTEINIKEKTTFLQTYLLKKSYTILGYFNVLLNYRAFSMLQSSPPISNFGEIESIKVLHDITNDKIYYANIKIHHSHYSFAKNYLDYQGSSSNFFYTQYNNSPYKFLNLATINYHKNIDKYVLEFASFDKTDCHGVEDTYRRIMETSYFKDKLYFYVNNSRWNQCMNIPTITSDELYSGQNYQALNLGDNYGYLRKIDIEDLNNSYLGRHDLVILNGIPNDVSVVSGIITTEFQTALSHINILSHNRQTPNMALKNAWTNPQLDSLLGKLVYLKVTPDSFVIRSAKIDEAEAFWYVKEPHTPIILEKDVETSGLVELSNANISSVNLIGGKAANFAELVGLGSIPVPENAFAIPFFYYQKHMTDHGLDTIVNNLLNDEEFKTNFEYRKAKLAELRQRIIDAPLNPEFLALVMDRIHRFHDFNAYRFRSSTNAEDLENFSGAGLYDSFSAKKDHQNKTVDRAIKKVWASLWNIRAFDEREYYMIDHHSVAMGILVHRSFPDEDANGVIVTKNLYGAIHGYTINVQYKEYSIVYPEPGIIQDQIIVYTLAFGDDNYTIEYLTHSNLPELNGESVLTDEELFEIADYCTTIKNYYFNHIPNHNNGYESFAVDIEFKLDSQLENRKIYIKQARIYHSDN